MTSDPLSSPLYVVCDAELCASRGWDLVDYAEACLDGGATLLQVRAKGLPTRDFLKASEAIVRRAEPFQAAVIVNDRSDVARMAGASGVHVGQDDLTPLQVRVVVGHDMLVGLSTHTAEQLDAALRQPINYVAIGPVFATGTKATGYEALGLEAVRAAAAMAAPRRLPLVCIGGVTLARARSVIEAGARSVAVISDLLATGRPVERVQAFLDALTSH
jgi:thiamine-phosphate pyrophosphorylase